MTKLGIVEDQRRRLKEHPVLSVVAAILVLVPVKAHLHRLYKYVYTKMASYNSSCFPIKP